MPWVDVEEDGESWVLVAGVVGLAPGAAIGWRRDFRAGFCAHLGVGFAVILARQLWSQARLPWEARRAANLVLAWFRERFPDEQQVVHAEREGHPQGHVRRKMPVLWLLHCGLRRDKAAEVAGLGRATVQRYVAAFRAGGLDGLRAWGVTGPVSDLLAHQGRIREELTRQLARSLAEACERIEQLTGSRRQPSQVRQSLKGMGLKFQRVRAVPVPPKEGSRSTFESRKSSSTPS